MSFASYAMREGEREAKSFWGCSFALKMPPRRIGR
jgi:hypothetical protein